MNAQRAPQAQSSTHPALSWWYTLAHEETLPAQLGVTAAALSEFADALAARGHTAPAGLIAQVTREVTRDEAVRRTLAVRRALGETSSQLGGDRYVWAFRRLGDAVTALRANHRSDYHAYPHPQSLREASLDRLYQRFPLDDYPRTTALLFTGMRVCDDPRLWADPCADTLAGAAPGLVAPENWDRYTLCGFRQGVALVRVSATARWLRVGPHALEDAWATTRREVEPFSARDADDGRLRLAEARARDALLRAAPAEAFMQLDDEVSLGASIAPSLARARRQESAPSGGLAPAPRSRTASHRAARPAV